MTNDDLILPPLAISESARADMTSGCRDCDDVPKVPRAGEVVHEGGTDIQIMHNGVRVVAGGYYGGWMTDIIRRLRGHHEPQEERVFHEVLKRLPEDGTMLELGAFWSYYSLWFLHGHAKRRSFVVEPDPGNLEIGRRNAALNGAHPVFIQASVGATSAPAVHFPSETAGMIEIPRIAVPELMAERGLQALDLLHCDTQGAEVEVVESCMELFRSHRIRFGFFSTHSYHISGDPLTHQRCLELISAAGGRILVEHDVQEGVSGDGLIVAYFGSEPLQWDAPKLTLNRYATSFFRNPLYDLAAHMRGLNQARARISELDTQLAEHARQAKAQPLALTQERVAELDARLATLAAQAEDRAAALKQAQERIGELEAERGTYAKQAETDAGALALAHRQIGELEAYSSEQAAQIEAGAQALAAVGKHVCQLEGRFQGRTAALKAQKDAGDKRSAAFQRELVECLLAEHRAGRRLGELGQLVSLIVKDDAATAALLLPLAQEAIDTEQSLRRRAAALEARLSAVEERRAAAERR